MTNRQPPSKKRRSVTAYVFGMNIFLLYFNRYYVCYCVIKMSTMRVIPFSAVLRLVRGSDTAVYMISPTVTQLNYYTTYNIYIYNRYCDAYTPSYNITIQIRRREQRVYNIVTKLDIIFGGEPFHTFRRRLYVVKYNRQ